VILFKIQGHEHPIDILQIRVTDEIGQPVFARPLWLGFQGKRRDEISLIDAYQAYQSRYDIEHFFRFGKQKLLMASYQTPDTPHEENWWQLSVLAYDQLFLARSMVKALPKPWERYLPAYQHQEDQLLSTATPSQTQRGFGHLLATRGSPSRACVPRGRATAVKLRRGSAFSSVF